MVFLPDIWTCIPDPERLANLQMADASGSMFPYVLASVITAIFEADSPSWAELRQNTWQGVYNITREEIEVDEIMLDVYFADQTWMTDVRTCVLLGGCAASVTRCSIYNFVNQP